MMTAQKQKLLEGPILSALIFLAVPIVLTNILQTAYQLTDAVWVGRLGGEAVAVMSLVFPISFLAIALGMGFSIAASTMVAQYAGAGKWQEVRHTASQSIVLAVVIGVMLSLVGVTYAPHILHRMGVSLEVYDLALQVVHISFFTMPFSFLFMTYQSLMRSVGEVTRPLYIVLGTVLLNMVIDPVLIFGWGGVPAFGVAGAAWATFLTQGISAFVGMYILMRGSHGIQVRLRECVPDMSLIKKITILGIPTSIEQIMRSLGYLLLTVLVVGYGVTEVAAYGVGANVLMVVLIPAFGLSMAVATLVGQNIGAGRPERAQEVVRIGSMLSFGFLTMAGIIAYTFARYIVAFFIEPGASEVIERAIAYIRVIAYSFGLVGVQMILFGAFRAAGRPGIALALTFVAQWVIQFPVALVLSRYTTLGVEGIWWAGPISQFMVLLCAVAWYMRGTWYKPTLTPEEKLAEHVAEEILIEEGVPKA
jgi:putative MATE family efflux protein